MSKEWWQDRVQRRHFIENLDEAIRLVIHAYHRFDLPKSWGDGQTCFC